MSGSGASWSLSPVLYHLTVYWVLSMFSLLRRMQKKCRSLSPKRLPSSSGTNAAHTRQAIHKWRLCSRKWPGGLRMLGPGRERPGEAEDFVTEEVTQSRSRRMGREQGRHLTAWHCYLNVTLSPNQIPHSQVSLTFSSVTSTEPAYSRWIIISPEMRVSWKCSEIKGGPLICNYWNC